MNNSNNIILGIDPGIADTGFGVVKVEGQKLFCLEYGSIKTDKKLDLSDRLVVLAKELERIIKKYKPKYLSIEELFFNKNVKTAITVAQARGVVLFLAKKNNLIIKNYTPLQIKQSVSCYGRADKNQVQKMVKLLLNLDCIPKPDDAADALAAAICASSSLNFKI
ncbi:crossover junction endodeoxyribonuclease RuvC [bacterium]|nr:crossover junction endodeoxyribonuclease RuvC [bacterium]